ncbi:MAG: response regulator [Calditrichaceae bacterium]|nr:response regulator [Calditrichaceae bacterium]
MALTKSILVVDDEPDAIEYVDAILSEIADFKIIPSYDGIDGQNKAKTELPDLIILDVMMPEKDGFRVFYDLQKDPVTKDIPIIMLTGVADKVGIQFFKKDMKAFMGKEPVDYIEKPLDPERLKESVKKIFK